MLMIIVMNAFYSAISWYFWYPIGKELHQTGGQLYNFAKPFHELHFTQNHHEMDG